MSAPVGFIGLGNMGWLMARNLRQAGREVIGYDLDSERAASFAAEFGGVAAAGPDDFAPAEVVVTMLPDGRAVAAALLDGGVAAPLGSGHAMKALNNYCGAAAYAVTAEALAVGQQFGLSGEVMIDVINTSTGRSFNSEVVYKNEVLTGRYGTNFALALLAKDVGIAAAIADSSHLDTPVLALINERWAQALDALGQGHDHSEAHKAWWDVQFAAGDEEAAAA